MIKIVDITGTAHWINRDHVTVMTEANGKYVILLGQVSIELTKTNGDTLLKKLNS